MNFESLSANIDYSKANLFNQYFHSVFHEPFSIPNTDDLPAIRDDSLQSITISLQNSSLIRCLQSYWNWQHLP